MSANFVEASAKNVQWLINRLHVESRNLMALGVHNPTFVILTESAEKRDAVEALIYKHIVAEYGDMAFKRIAPDAKFKTSTRMVLPPLNAAILLMDI